METDSSRGSHGQGPDGRRPRAIERARGFDSTKRRLLPRGSAAGNQRPGRTPHQEADSGSGSCSGVSAYFTETITVSGPGMACARLLEKPALRNILSYSAKV